MAAEAVRRAFAVALAAAATWLVLDAGGLDLAVAHAFFDPATGTFPLKDDWWFAAAGHTGLKHLSLVLWMRGFSAHSCPWDLAGFGGEAAHFSLGETAPANPGPGGCLPAAHASSGFALFGLYFALSEFRPRAARLALILAWALGLVAGFVQVARGAHFASHVLWTAGICWIASRAAHASIASARRACSRSLGSRGS